MENILTVKELCKTYPSFSLKNVSFSVEKGSIMGFIGRNGAGKTTTIKSIVGLVHPENGEISFLGKKLQENEAEIKLQIGYAGGGNSYYKRKKLKDIVSVTKSFYPNWDNEEYLKYMSKFSLDENKKLLELSEGMKVKFQLALALSHHAELLILDEPTSGLDPISRDELLEIFLSLADKGVSIFFSTHITSDLDKCADMITYIKCGEIIASCSAKKFVDSYRIVSLLDEPSGEQKAVFLGVSRSVAGKKALILQENSHLFANDQLEMPDLEAIMLHLEKEEWV